MSTTRRGNLRDSEHLPAGAKSAVYSIEVCVHEAIARLGGTGEELPVRLRELERTARELWDSLEAAESEVVSIRIPRAAAG